MVVGNPHQAKAGITLSQLDLEVVPDHLCKATMTRRLYSKGDSQNLNLGDLHRLDQEEGTLRFNPMTVTTSFLSPH